MSTIITLAYLAVLASAAFVVLRWGAAEVEGETPVSTFTLVALLFTAGLDMGLVMLPLHEFPVYAEVEAYGFTNPLAIAFGMWGPLVWIMYFLATFYFVALEPRLQIFEIRPVRLLYNAIIIATTAFTIYLFISTLPDFIPGLPAAAGWLVGGAAIAIAIYSASEQKFMKWLALTSAWAFGLLLVTALVFAEMYARGKGVEGLPANLVKLITGYFTHIGRFALPITESHEFYLFWWFAWSIMIGQFIATYAGGLPVWRLAIAMVALPTLPIAFWLAALFIFHKHGIEVPAWMMRIMIFVGVIFVINSLDSLVRLYSGNLGWERRDLGWGRYFLLHFLLISALVLLYQFTTFRIEYVGLIVIGIYALTYAIILMRARDVVETVEEQMPD